MERGGGGGVSLKKYMHKDNVRKKNMHRLTAPKKNTCKGMRLIYIIYVNLGKTGFVDFEHSLY